MTHPIQRPTHTCLAAPPAQGAPHRRPTIHPGNRLLLLAPLAGLLLALASCTGDGLPPAPLADTGPIGDGLKVLGYAVLGAAVVTVLGRLIR